ncbi:MAG: lipoate--protein ligase family protein [Gemmatimonadaceae bacterium]|nr:lipoate--protein ligase family protein [Gemmatimonadaceae bacterium]
MTPEPLWAGPVHLLRADGPRTAVDNMALDEALLRTAAEQGGAWVRIYAWDRPSVSFGRNQRTLGFYHQDRCDALGVPTVRRLTGGRALLHGREVTYSVAAPTSRAPTLRGGYEAINSLLLDALRGLGVPATRSAPATRTPSPGLAPCFETPSAGELVVNGRKLVGSAQHREAGAFIQHGSILLDDDQGVLSRLALVPLPPVPPPATLRASLAAVTFPAVAAAIEAALRRVAAEPVIVLPDDAIAGHHVDAARSRYRDPHWTWRR